MKIIRIQRKRIKGWKMPLNTVYVGRPTRWGNPWIVNKNNKAKDVVNHYEEWVMSNGLFVLDIKTELEGKNLACWCPLNQPCHADVLLKIANS